MDCYDDTVKLDIFKYNTTYQNDYRKYCDVKRHIHKPYSERSEPPKKATPPPAIYDHESFARWRDNIHIPFDLLLKPKDIVGTDPYKPFQKLAPIASLQKEESIKTRPRVYMTPAASVDDVDDPQMRELLCNYMYTTEWRKAEKEATANYKGHETKLLLDSRNVGTSDPVKLQVDLYKPIEESFQRRGKEWDDPQRRALTDSTTEFWLYKDPPVLCGACVNPFKGVVPEETKKEISHLIAEDKLRMPHDYPPPSYAGYKMRLAKGVPLAKVHMPVVHPSMSTYQATTARYADDMKK